MISILCSTNPHSLYFIIKSDRLEFPGSKSLLEAISHHFHFLLSSFLMNDQPNNQAPDEINLKTQSTLTHYWMIQLCGYIQDHYLLSRYNKTRYNLVEFLIWIIKSTYAHTYIDAIHMKFKNWDATASHNSFYFIG